MNLEEIINQLNEFDQDGHICRAGNANDPKSWIFKVVGLDDSDDPVVPDGFKEFMDVGQFRDGIHGLERMKSSPINVPRVIKWIMNDA